MEKAEIQYKVDIASTLSLMKIGKEYVLPGTEFDVNRVRKTASAIKKLTGLRFRISQFKGCQDIYVTREK